MLIRFCKPETYKGATYLPGIDYPFAEEETAEVFKQCLAYNNDPEEEAV